MLNNYKKIGKNLFILFAYLTNAYSVNGDVALAHRDSTHQQSIESIVQTAPKFDKSSLATSAAMQTIGQMRTKPNLTATPAMAAPLVGPVEEALGGSLVVAGLAPITPGAITTEEVQGWRRSFLEALDRLKQKAQITATTNPWDTLEAYSSATNEADKIVIAQRIFGERAEADKIITMINAIPGIPTGPIPGGRAR